MRTVLPGWFGVDWGRRRKRWRTGCLVYLFACLSRLSKGIGCACVALVSIGLGSQRFCTLILRITVSQMCQSNLEWINLIDRYTYNKSGNFL